MFKFVEAIADRLAQTKSRRGFLGTVIKVVFGGAAVVAGVAIGEKVAEASVPIKCCHLDPGQSSCPTLACPSGSQNYYTWACCYVPGPGQHAQGYSCHDCFYTNGSGFVCTFPTANHFVHCVG